MSFNRSKNHDRLNTLKFLQDPPETFPEKNWLDHSGACANIDALLLTGADFSTLLTSGRKPNAVRSHINHLKKDHGLAIEHMGDLYKFSHRLNSAAVGENDQIKETVVDHGTLTNVSSSIGSADEAVKFKPSGFISESKKGYVYILVNPAFSGFVKVGKTRKQPEVRAKELSSGSGVPAPYSVVWDTFVTDCDQVESLVHRELANMRARHDREFFTISLKQAISIVSSIAGRFACDPEEPPLETSQKTERLNSKSLRVKQFKTGDPLPNREELIEIAEDSDVIRAIEPPINGTKRTIARIKYDVLIEHPYEFTERELFHQVHVLRRNRPDLKIKSYNIKRSPLLQEFGWGIHRNKEGKLALVPVESEKYKELQKSVKRTKSYRKNKERP